MEAVGYTRTEYGSVHGGYARALAEPSHTRSTATKWDSRSVADHNLYKAPARVYRNLAAKPNATVGNLNFRPDTDPLEPCNVTVQAPAEP